MVRDKLGQKRHRELLAAMDAESLPMREAFAKGLQATLLRANPGMDEKELASRATDLAGITDSHMRTIAMEQNISITEAYSRYKMEFSNAGYDVLDPLDQLNAMYRSGAGDIDSFLYSLDTPQPNGKKPY